jgi:hypothetical protein
MSCITQCHKVKKKKKYGLESDTPFLPKKELKFSFVFAIWPWAASVKWNWSRLFQSLIVICAVQWLQAPCLLGTCRIALPGPLGLGLVTSPGHRVWMEGLQVTSEPEHLRPMWDPAEFSLSGRTNSNAQDGGCSVEQSPQPIYHGYNVIKTQIFRY